MAVLAILGAFALVAASTLWRGFVLSVLWLWFIASQFGLPALTVPQAIGLSLAFGLLSHRYVSRKDVPFSAVAADAFVTPLLMLGIAWIVRGFL